MNKKYLIIALIVMVLAIVLIIMGSVLKNKNDVPKPQDSGEIIVVDTDKLNNYLGIWYENETSINEDKRNVLKIKDVNNSDFKIDLIINDVHFNDIRVAHDGKFVSENIEGQITFDVNSIKIVINQAEDNVLNNDYVFNYHVQEGSLPAYIGEWYLDNQPMNIDYDPYMVIIKKVGNNQITFDFYAHISSSFKNITVSINNNSGTFNGTSSDDENIEGTIKLENNHINLVITKSNAENLYSSSEFDFTYQKTNN